LKQSKTAGGVQAPQETAHICGVTASSDTAQSPGASFIPLPGTDAARHVQSDENMRRVLGIDPGIRSTGYAIVDYAKSRYRLVVHGVNTTDSKHEKPLRLNTIYDEMAQVIAAYAPREAGMESLFFARNVSSALSVSEARGVLMVCLHKNGVGLSEYTPNAIKQAVTGSARAEKKTVQEFVRLLLGLDSIPKTDHEADAIAAAITHIHLGAANNYVKTK
jgi:crossover junction endodeoxyribonuclease RuvC